MVKQSQPKPSGDLYEKLLLLLLKNTKKVMDAKNSH
jgi:hypothetical protein